LKSDVNDEIFGENRSGRNYYAYIYHGKYIRYDAPGNIHFGYVWNAAGHDLNSALWGGSFEQLGGADDFYDQKMVIDGYIKYNYDTYDN